MEYRLLLHQTRGYPTVTFLPSICYWKDNSPLFHFRLPTLITPVVIASTCTPIIPAQSQALLFRKERLQLFIDSDIFFAMPEIEVSRNHALESKYLVKVNDLAICLV